ncbi:MAG: YolD-like family protein [Bacillota bacterium]
MHSDAYRDRGIIKWTPFDALVGYHSLIKELRYRLGKRDKPILSDDQYEELNRKLNWAYHQNSEIEIEFFNQGYSKYTFGTIRRLDWINKVVILSSFEKINAYDIIEIHITY